MTETLGRAFIVRPFGAKSNVEGEAKIDFDAVEAELIAPAIKKAGMTGGTTAEFVQQGNIRSDMFRELLIADLVVADISIHNANAFYELGIRHALCDRHTVMIKANKRGDPHVFDLKVDRYLPYDPDDPAASLDKLVKTIAATRAQEGSDSPVFDLIPGLNSLDRGEIDVVPRDFREEVIRIGDDKEKLRALSEKVTTEYWATGGLRVIGRAQFKIGDHEGSIRTWGSIRELEPDDVEANQKLATNFQKTAQYKESEIAANRALNANQLNDWESAETYALIGSNLKTQWQLMFKEENDLSDRQRKALSSQLLTDSYEAYRKGFEKHRSHYYSGINAVATLAMKVALARLQADRWALEFDDEEEAERALRKLEKHLGKLVAATELAIHSSIRNYPQDVWARLSKADLALLSESNPARVGLAYEKCEGIDGFNEESLRRQLEIYGELGLFAENVEAALEAVSA